MTDAAPTSTLADLRLDDVVVESLVIRTNTDGPPDPRAHDLVPEPAVTLDILRVKDELKFLMPFRVRMNTSKSDFRRFGYSLDLKLLGFFSFEAGFDEHQAGHMIHASGPPILYGVARGIAAQALALTVAGKMLLPSINFVEIMRRRDHQLHRRRTLGATVDENTALEPASTTD